MSLINPLSVVAEAFLQIFALLPLPVVAAFSLAIGSWFVVNLLIGFLNL